MLYLLEKFDTVSSRGMLSKAWYMDDKGNKMLVKGNSISSGVAGYEPFSEVLAYRIARLLGLPSIKYILVSKKRFKDVNVYGRCEYVSVCGAIPTVNAQRLSFSKYAILKGYGRSDPFYTYNALGLNTEFLCKMLAFDAFIGNPDRHYGNFELYVSRDSVTNVPIFDNGASLLAWKDSKYVSKIRRGNRIYSDVSKPFKKTHMEQIEFLKRYYGVRSILGVVNKEQFYSNLFNNCEDVFSKMPEYRVKGIKTYLLNRHIYLD